MASKKPKTTKGTKITFHNKINNGFRQVHVDGALGGVTSRGLININFYAERLPIAKSTDFNIKPDGRLGAKIKDSDDSKFGIIREYDFGIYITKDTAIQLKIWLEDKIRNLEELEKIQKKK